MQICLTNVIIVSLYSYPLLPTLMRWIVVDGRLTNITVAPDLTIASIALPTSISIRRIL